MIRVLVICESYEQYDAWEKKYQRIIKKNHIVDIDCGCRANSLCKRYPDSEWISDLAIVRAGKRMTVTYYSEIKSP